jgi:hypothetical protein
MEVAHHGSRLTVVALVRRGKRYEPVQRHYTLDGCDNAVFTPGRIEFISAACTGRAIRIRSIQRNEERVLLEEWLLSQDGKELRIKRSAGGSVQRLVFRRSTELPE